MARDVGWNRSASRRRSDVRERPVIAGRRRIFRRSVQAAYLCASRSKLWRLGGPAMNLQACPSRNTAGCPARAARGFILIGVLILVMLISMIALSLMFRLRADETAASATSGGDQAFSAAMAGVQ